MSGSTRFDRAAPYYDATRGRTPEGVARETAVLAAELDGRAPILEVGVGTGQVAIPLHAAGLDIVGLDISRPMLSVLLEKAGGAPPFPLLEADATRMPIRDDAFGGAYLRWVLHLISDWRAAIAEIARVVRPGGVALFILGGDGAGPQEDIRREFSRIAGVPPEPVGLRWRGDEELDDAMAEHGATSRHLDVFTDVESMSVEDLVVGIEENVYSWTWPVPDEVRTDASARVRAWAEERYGPLADLPRQTYEVHWRAYDLP